MKAQRLKITQAGWTNFSDYLGSTLFKDGISVEAVAPSIAAQLGSIVSLEGIDDELQAGAGTRQIAGDKVSAEVKVAMVDAAHPETKKQAVKSSEGESKYTRESLETTADELGISGLREIADKYGVKGRGIVELIEGILAAQG